MDVDHLISKATCMPASAIAPPETTSLMVNSSVHEPSNKDVLCGRGKAIQKHDGNVAFRTLISDALWAYRSHAKKKGAISQAIIDTVGSFGGRFLTQDRDGRYTELTADQQRAKVGHAFRDAVKLSNKNDIQGDVDMQNECQPMLEDCRERLRKVLQTQPPQRGRRLAITAMSDTVLRAAGKPSKRRVQSSMPTDHSREKSVAHPTKSSFSMQSVSTLLLECSSSLSLSLDFPPPSITANNSCQVEPPQTQDCSSERNGRSSLRDSGMTTLSIMLRKSIESWVSGVTAMSGILNETASIDNPNSCLELTEMECDYIAWRIVSDASALSEDAPQELTSDGGQDLDMTERVDEELDFVKPNYVVSLSSHTRHL